MMETSARARAELAPGGMIRAAINTANPATVRIADDGTLSGPCIDLAHGLSEAVELPVEFIRFSSAAQVVAAELVGDVWDLAFLAVDPARVERLHFSPPYLTIEAAYAVPTESQIVALEDVDRPGIRIATSEGAAYDLHLKRRLQFAERCPFPGPQASFDAFAGGGYDVLAGVRLALERRFGGRSATRILDGDFLTISQAMVVPVGRPAAAEVIDRFIANQQIFPIP